MREREHKYVTLAKKHTYRWG